MEFSAIGSKFPRNSQLYWTVLAATLLCGLGAVLTPISFAQAQSENSVTEPAIVYNKPLNIESMSDSHICGRDSSGKRVCVGKLPPSLQPGDTVSKLKSFIAGGNQFCGRDERGIKCWQTEGNFQKPLHEILASGETEMVRFGLYRVCIPQKDGMVHCHQPETEKWVTTNGANELRTLRPPMESYGPFADLRDFRILQDDICFLDGENLSCLPLINDKENNPGYTPREVFPDGPYKGARSIAGSWNSICVLSDSGLHCALGREAKEKKTFAVAEEWTSATDLKEFGYESYCARAKSGGPLCVRVDSSSMQVTDAVPEEFKKPGVNVLKFDVAEDRMCVITKDQASGKRSFSCLIYSSVSELPTMNNLVDFKVTGNSICGVDEKGWVHCFTGTHHQPSPLPEDGSEVQVAGQCRWNNSRFYCSDLEMSESFDDVSRVIAVSPNLTEGQHPCIIYENRQNVRSVRCFGSNQHLTTNSPLVEGDMSKIASRYKAACIYGGQAVNCWGSDSEPNVPNLNSVRKLVFGSDYACASDQFGFVCWGNDIENRGLTPPSGLSDIDYVQDFGVGDEHVCAITRENRIECWGKNSSGQLDAPVVSNPTSLAISGRTTCVSSDQGVTCWGLRQTSLSGAAKPTP